MSETIDAVQATWNASKNAVEGFISQQSYGRRIVLMAVQGPKNSTLTIYRGAIANFSGSISRIYPADSRTYDAATEGGPIDIRAGEVACFQWTGGNSGPGLTATCTVISKVVD